MRFPGRRARVSVTLGLVLIALLAIPVVDQFFFRYGWARQALDDIDARYARLLGLHEAAPRLQKALIDTVAALDRHAYPAETGADRIGADIQQRVRGLAEATGIAVVGSQILPPKTTAGLELITMAATLDADVASLRDFLLALPAQQPSIQVDSLTVTTVRQRGPAADSKIRVQINLSAIHLLP